MEPLDIQIYRVFVMALAGIATGLLLDVYRIFRWATSPRGFIVHLQDLVFWLVVTPLLILSLLVSNWVDLRLYMFAGFGFGLGSYLLLASPVVVLALRFIVTLIARAVGAVKRAFRWLRRRAVAPSRRISSFCSRLSVRARQSPAAAFFQRIISHSGLRWKRR